MDFESKPDIKELLGHEKMDQKIIDAELTPAIESFDEPHVGPAEHDGPERDKAPDPSALAAWVDDLSDYTDNHRGEPLPSELMDKIANHAAEDALRAARSHAREDVSAEMEQHGIVNDFHADSAIEGAAVAVPGQEKTDESLADVLQRPKIDEGDDEGGSGGGAGGSGGAGGPPGEPGEGGGDGAPGDDKPKKKTDGKATDKPDKPADKPKPGDKAKPEPKKPEPTKRDDKKRDGDR